MVLYRVARTNPGEQSIHFLCFLVKYKIDVISSKNSININNSKYHRVFIDGS